jgi:hypothetical protein
MKAEFPITEHGFMPNRYNLVEIAAYLDRIQRHGELEDPRNVAFLEALNHLSSMSTEKAKDILDHFSDPSTDPILSSDNKPASGAWSKPEKFQ